MKQLLSFKMWRKHRLFKVCIVHAIQGKWRSHVHLIYLYFSRHYIVYVGRGHRDVVSVADSLYKTKKCSFSSTTVSCMQFVVQFPYKDNSIFRVATYVVT